jgi:hypothetical protein
MCVRVAEDLRSTSNEPAEHAHLGDVELVLVTDPDGADCFGDVSSLVVSQLDGKLSERWQIPGTPYAVAIGHDGDVRASCFVTNVAQLYKIAGTLQAV